MNYGNFDVRAVAEKITKLQQYTKISGTQTHKSQSALIKNLTPEQTAEVASLVLEMLGGAR
jgi:hypothetical protein